jgi:hypothetical protein
MATLGSEGQPNAQHRSYLERGSPAWSAMVAGRAGCRQMGSLCSAMRANAAPYSPRRRTLAPVALLSDLDAFYTEHRCCGGLDGGVDGDRVWLACTCGGLIKRGVGPAPPVAAR